MARHEVCGIEHDWQDSSAMLIEINFQSYRNQLPAVMTMAGLPGEIGFTLHSPVT